MTVVFSFRQQITPRVCSLLGWLIFLSWIFSGLNVDKWFLIKTSESLPAVLLQQVSSSQPSCKVLHRQVCLRRPSGEADGA